MLVASLSSLALAGRVGAACPSAAGVAIANAPDPVPRAQIVFRGHGWGHGLGMSQYGAQGAARLGCGYHRILRTYYTGTRVTPAVMPATVSVRMTENVRRASVTLLSGAVVWRNGNRLVFVQRTGGLRVRRIGANSAELLRRGRRVWAGPVSASGLRAVHRAGVVRLNSPTDPYAKLPMSLRWDSISFHVDGARMDVVKVFRNNRHGRAMDKYLLGLAEVPASWPAAALRAQVVAARTFAVQRAAALLPTVAHQNYDGYDHDARRHRRRIAVAGRGVGDEWSGHRRPHEPADRCLLLVLDGRMDRGQRLLVGRRSRVVPATGQRQPLGPGVRQPVDVALVDAGLHAASRRAGARLHEGHERLRPRAG